MLECSNVKRQQLRYLVHLLQKWQVRLSHYTHTTRRFHHLQVKSKIKKTVSLRLCLKTIINFSLYIYFFNTSTAAADDSTMCFLNVCLFNLLAVYFFLCEKSLHLRANTLTINSISGLNILHVITIMSRFICYNWVQEFCLALLKPIHE